MGTPEREDLGAMFSRITRRLIEAERPLLAAHGLTMWGYVVLTRLAGGAASSQLELANAIGYDKTRLIALLDELERAGLLSRRPDANDRRAHVVQITAAGAGRHAAAVEDIRAMEAELLSGLTAAERRALLAVLPKLAGSGTA